MRDKVEAMSFWEKVGTALVILTILGLFGLIVFRIAFVTFVDSYELGYVYYGRTGKVVRLDRTGYVVTTPFLNSVHAIDLRPGQVCMNANSRVLNCKLVKFNPNGFDKFIEWHGRGAGDSAQGQVNIYEILKSYAFNVNEGRDCPFLTISDDMRRKDSAVSTPIETPTPEAPKPQ